MKLSIMARQRASVARQRLRPLRRPPKPPKQAVPPWLRDQAVKVSVLVLLGLFQHYMPVIFGW
jgi:hypothetical protein